MDKIQKNQQFHRFFCVFSLKSPSQALAMEIILIAAMDPNGIIGHKNQIPWHIPEEMQHFKETTMGHTVLMGRRTFESIGKALPGRKNIVLSTDHDFAPPHCQVFHTLEAGLSSCSNQEKVFIIGGKTVYQQAIALANTILLSVLHREYAGDSSFPDIPPDRFRLTTVKECGTGQQFTLKTYCATSTA